MHGPSGLSQFSHGFVNNWNNLKNKISKSEMCLMPFITSSEQRYTELTWLHQNQKPFGTKYSRVDQVKFFKGCLPRIFTWSKWYAKL